MKTFKELEQLAYMSNLPKIAAVYAQLDDNEVAEYEIERLYAKIDDLEFDCEYNEQKVFRLEDKIEKLEDTLKKIEDIINE
jgi:peptidoglycan hydrolase CwlO-like protein